MDLAPQILEMLAKEDGLKAAELAKQLGVNRSRINSILYGPLKGQVRQDKSFRWHLSARFRQMPFFTLADSAKDGKVLIPLAPKQFSGSLEDLYSIHLSKVMLSPESVEIFHDKLMDYLNSDAPIHLIRKVSGLDRGEIMESRFGDRMKATDNSPGWYVHHQLFCGSPDALSDFGTFISSIPCHMFGIKLPQNISSADWHVAHLFNAKNHDTDFFSWDRVELRRRMVRNLHPCNLFYIPKTDWRIHGGAPEVLAFMYKKFSELYSDVWEEFLKEANASPILGNYEQYRYRIGGKASSPKAIGNILKPKNISAEYSYSRLCFKRDIIEPLDDCDFFSVVIPEGRFIMSKAQFYETFDNVVRSKNYREDGVYHYSSPPQKSLIFYLPKP